MCAYPDPVSPPRVCPQPCHYLPPCNHSQLPGTSALVTGPGQPCGPCPCVDSGIDLRHGCVSDPAIVPHLVATAYHLTLQCLWLGLGNHVDHLALHHLWLSLAKYMSHVHVLTKALSLHCMCPPPCSHSRPPDTSCSSSAPSCQGSAPPPRSPPSSNLDLDLRANQKIDLLISITFLKIWKTDNVLFR